jgi:hypothetical protein
MTARRPPARHHARGASAHGWEPRYEAVRELDDVRAQLRIVAEARERRRLQAVLSVVDERTLGDGAVILT